MRTYRVKELAKAQGITQFDLAAKSGVSMALVQRLWQNRAPDGIRLKSLEAVAGALGVTVQDLFVELAEDEGQGAILPDKRMSLAGAPL